MAHEGVRRRNVGGVLGKVGSCWTCQAPMLRPGCRAQCRCGRAEVKVPQVGWRDLWAEGGCVRSSR